MRDGEFTALIDVQRQAVAFLEAEQRHAQTGSGVVELLRRLLDRIADKHRGGDLLALVLGSDMPEHLRNLGAASRASNPAHPVDELARVGNPG